MDERIWATYSRISEDPHDTRAGVDRQAKDSAAYVRRRGGRVSKTYVENDTSAFKRRRTLLVEPDGTQRYGYRVIRPVFQQMLTDLRSGVITAAVVYDLDRFVRDPRDLEDAIEVAQHYGRTVVDHSGTLDLSTDAGRAMARVMTAMANKASADTSRRVSAWHRHRALQGAPLVGHRPFGWNDDRLTLHPIEGPILREWIDRALAGETYSAIARDAQAAGIVGTRGKPFMASSMRRVMLSERVCGYRTLNGSLLTDDAGAPVLGAWEAICTPQEWATLTGRWTPIKSLGGNRHTERRKYLLSGVIRCGKCGKGMCGTVRSGREGWVYKCPAKDRGGCGGTQRNGPRLDEFVMTYVAELLPEKGVRPSATHPVCRALEDAQHRLSETTSAYAAGKMTSDTFYKLLPALEAAVTDLKRRQPRARLALVTKNIKKAWADLPLPTRRIVIREYISAVEVLPLDVPRHGWEPDKIRIIPAG